MTEEMKLSLTEEEALLVRVLVIQKNSELKNKVKEGASLCEFLAGIQATAEVVEEKTPEPKEEPTQRSEAAFYGQES